MAKIEITCSACGTNNQINNATKGLCSKCGASLFSNTNFLDLIIKGNELLKDEDFKQLRIVAVSLIKINKNAFIGYAFLACSDLKIDLFKSSTLEPIIINKNDIELDMKSRLYYEARKLYKDSDKRYVDALNKFYKSEIDYSKNKERRMVTNFDKQISKIEMLEAQVNEHGTLLKKKLVELAESKDEQIILQNYFNYCENLAYSTKELHLYDKAANNYIYSDLNKTSSPGNKKKFYIYITTLSLDVIAILLSMVTIIFGYVSLTNNLKIFSLFAPVFTSVVILITMGILLKRVDILNYKKRVVAKWFISLIVLCFCAAGISTTYFSFVKESGFFAIWFYIISLPICISMAVYSGIIIYRSKPKNNKLTSTLLGDIKKLSLNNFEVNFPFEFKKYKPYKICKANISLSKYNK